MTIDLAPLWDFSQPAVSETRFREALKTASKDDALILQTQIARTYSLRKEFIIARDLLQSIANDMPAANAEAQVRYALELGRTYASATHSRDQLTDESRTLARSSYENALDIAKVNHIDTLAIDAIHMLAFVDSAPADQLKWNLAALAIVESSTQPAAKKWEPAVRNNIGYSLHQLGRYSEALDQFQRAVVLRERGTNAKATRVAHWMVAWTLRSMDRTEEALNIQLRLERECEAAHEPDTYVYEELEILYRKLGNESRAQHYVALKLAAVN